MCGLYLVWVGMWWYLRVAGVRGPCGGLQVGILFCRCPVCGFTCA